MGFFDGIKKQASKGFAAYKEHNKPENRLQRAKQEAEISKFRAVKRKNELVGRANTGNGIRNGLDAIGGASSFETGRAAGYQRQAAPRTKRKTVKRRSALPPRQPEPRREDINDRLNSFKI